MAAKLRNILLFTILGGIALASWILNRQPDRIAVGRAGLEPLPLGYYLRDATLENFDADGKALYTVHAAILEQASADDDLVLRQVRVEYEPDADVHWQLSAGLGSAPSDGAHLDLADGVRLSNEPDSGSEPTVIETEALRLDGHEFLARSDRQVTVRRGKSELLAAGLEAHLKDDRLELPNVRGRFYP